MLGYCGVQRVTFLNQWLFSCPLGRLCDTAMVSAPVQAFPLSGCIFLNQEEVPAPEILACVEFGVKGRIWHFNQDFCPASTKRTCSWLITPNIDIVIIHAAKLPQCWVCVNGLWVTPGISQCIYSVQSLPFILIRDNGYLKTSGYSLSCIRSKAWPPQKKSMPRILNNSLKGVT